MEPRSLEATIAPDIAEPLLELDTLITGDVADEKLSLNSFVARSNVVLGGKLIRAKSGGSVHAVKV